MNDVFSKLDSIWDYLFAKGGLIASTILTAFLTAIGYPAQVINFVIVLMVCDILTRWVAEIVKAYGRFSLMNFLKAWKDKVLNSKKLKHGLFIKIFFYAIILYIAHQAGITTELAFGKVISNFLYSILIVLDCISIFENMIDAGFSKFKPILDYFNKKKNLLIDNNDINIKVDDIDTNEIKDNINNSVG